MRITPEEAAELVVAASHGDRSAWERLVDAYVGLIWAITRSYRLSDGDAQDVSQTTWLRLVENIDRLSDPARVGAWLATTARRECLRVLRHARRQVLLAEWEEMDDFDPGGVEVDTALLRAEQDDAVRVALEQLPARCQALLGLLMLDPPPSYDEVSAALGMPIGSIGPTRGRCLHKLLDLIGDPRIGTGPGGISPS